ncbi:MAG: DsbA family protein [Caldilineaceae bacterium SB0661_bin_32]|uniref:DsbA family protein n=1 Tax=Caldilineaceae bacterium SB0661_bin_32 TaxID=2605255 RepID=A0A6B1DBV8_9CHLR|nr:DsbA family protein [Caldilineaceae bacterium SB0661_bin_32]
MKAKDLIANSRRRLSLSIYLVGGVALLAGLLAVILAAATDNESISVELPDYSGISSAWQNRNILGDPDAPVTVQAWEDFRCPACAAFNQRVKPGLVDNYISSGKVKLEFRHFPLQQHEPGASLAAQASECAADQGRFWVYHDRVFQATSSGANAFLMERLIDYAGELDLDQDTFTSCLTNQEHMPTISESLQAARTAGHNSTPTVLVNGERVDNPLDYGTVSAAIDRRLSSDQ